MKYLATIHQLNNLDLVLTLADGILLGNEEFATRLTNSFDIAELNSAFTTIKKAKKLAFLVINQMMTDQKIKALKTFLSSLELTNIAGFIIGDLGCLSIFTQLGLSHKLIYNPGTLLTNHFDFNYLKTDNFYGGFIAKEINIDDILLIGKNRLIKTFYIGNGYLDMFYSKRQLLKNYNEYLDENQQYQNNQNLRLSEEKRNQERFPVLEDQAGTSVFRPKVFACLSELNTLSQAIDYLVVDSIFLSDQYTVDILNLYRHNQLSLSELEDKYKIAFDDGFLHKTTIYKPSKTE